jgi:hypothetical protein
MVGGRQRESLLALRLDVQVRQLIAISSSLGRRPASLLQNFSSLHMLQSQQQASPPPPQQQLYTLHESSRQQPLQQSQELEPSALSSGGFDP